MKQKKWLNDNLKQEQKKTTNRNMKGATKEALAPLNRLRMLLQPCLSVMSLFVPRLCLSVTRKCCVSWLWHVIGNLICIVYGGSNICIWVFTAHCFAWANCAWSVSKHVITVLNYPLLFLSVEHTSSSFVLEVPQLVVVYYIVAKLQLTATSTKSTTEKYI